MKKVIWLLAIAATSHFALAQKKAVAQQKLIPEKVQDSCSCCTTPYKQFNFWVGKWVVYDNEGKIIGENTVESVQDGCAITENWKGLSGLNSNSLNYYQPADSTWYQTLIDNKGHILHFKGKMEDGKMVLKTDLIKNKINWYYNKMTWTRNADGTLTQRWETYDKKDKVQSLVFLGTYKRR